MSGTIHFSINCYSSIIFLFVLISNNLIIQLREVRWRARVFVSSAEAHSRPACHVAGGGRVLHTKMHPLL